ncbi:MAG: protein kinase domain-containing protein [Pyrinomonadaceae bacterium]
MKTGTVKIMSDQFSGKVLADKYRIDEPIRDGNAGTIYRATHLAMGKPVAVKILPRALAVDDTISRRFSEEAKTLSRIAHPNILNVTDYGTDKDGTAFIVTEPVEGESLKTAIKNDGKFSLERANRVVRQIAAALSVAHANGVNHQNLTSENVFLTKTATDADEIKVLDFGAVKFNENAEISAAEAEYLAPEQIADSTKADARSDVYSLGIILYEMLAGEVPFAAEKPTDVLLKHAQEPPLPLSAFRTDLPNEASQIILTALAKNPDMRYQTANDFAAALNRATISSDAAGAIAASEFAAPASTVSPVEQPQNNIWKTAFIVLAGIAVFGFFLIRGFSVKQTDPTTRLATDANGSPVQPVNPATGTSEQSLSNMSAYNPDLTSGNSNTGGAMPGGMPPQTLPGGDGYDPWRNGGKPPTGAPAYPNYPVYSSNGQMIVIDPNSNSPFMPSENRYVLVPKNANSNVNTTSPNKTKGKNPAANTNTQTTPTNTAKPPQSPAANTAAPKAEPTPATKKSTPKPTPQKSAPSGKQQDSQE